MTTKICFITAIYSQYEKTCKPFIQQTIPTDFICFTSEPDMQPNGWIIDTTPYHLENPNPFDDHTYVNSLCNNQHTFNIAKYYKQSFQYIPRLRAYDVVIWIDATVEIHNDRVSEYIMQHIYSHKIIGWHHEWRHGKMMEEVKASLVEDKYKYALWNNQLQPFQDVAKQYDTYVKHGYRDDFFNTYRHLQEPTREHFGMWVTCFVAFLQHDPAVARFLELWYLQTLKHTTQDQVSFAYVCQKMQMVPMTLPNHEITGDHPHDGTHFYRKHDHGR